VHGAREHLTTGHLERRERWRLEIELGRPAREAVERDHGNALGGLLGHSRRRRTRRRTAMKGLRYVLRRDPSRRNAVRGELVVDDGGRGGDDVVDRDFGVGGRTRHAGG